MALITLEQAATQLGLTGPEYADILEMKMAEAEALVLEVMKITEADLAELGWTSATPHYTSRRLDIARGAILEVTSNLVADRGDREKSLDGPISARLMNKLSTQRDPTIA